MGEVPQGVRTDSDRMMRFLSFAPLLMALALAVLVIAPTLVYTAGTTAATAAVALSILYLPAHLYHLWCATHARRPRGGLWTLAAVAVPIMAGLPLVGFTWLPALVSLIASVATVLPVRWAVAASCVILAGVVPLELALNPRPNPAWTLIVVLERSGVVLVPTWFAGGLRRLRAAREALAAQAVLRERDRVDGELARTVGAWLQRTAEEGPRVALLTRTDSERAAIELSALVDGSRRTLAGARELIRGYRPVSLRKELDAAVVLLSAIGVRTLLVVPDGGLPDRGRQAQMLARDLHAAVDRLLQDDAVASCRLTVAGSGDRLRLTVTADRGRG